MVFLPLYCDSLLSVFQDIWVKIQVSLSLNQINTKFRIKHLQESFHLSTFSDNFLIVDHINLQFLSFILVFLGCNISYTLSDLNIFELLKDLSLLSKEWISDPHNVFINLLLNFDSHFVHICDIIWILAWFCSNSFSQQMLSINHLCKDSHDFVFNFLIWNFHNINDPVVFYDSFLWHFNSSNLVVNQDFVFDISIEQLSQIGL